MGKKTELLVTAGDLQEAERMLQAGADAISIGHERYALRMPGSFELPDIRDAVALARHFQAKVYVSINALLHNDSLPELNDYIRQLNEAGVDAIVFGDPAVLMASRLAASKLKLHWNTETTSTNYRTVNYWAGRGVARAILARELSMEEVLYIKQNTKIEVQVQVHGATCIFHSRRELVGNYMQHQGRMAEEGNRSRNRHMFLKEKNRSEERYPIFEDRHGTHILSAEDICMLEHLGPFLTAGIDSFKIEGLLKTADYNAAVVSLYRKAIDCLADNPNAGIHPGWLAELRSIQPPDRPLGTGFYFREQIY
ncbi:peptidase U32 family protein [Effusibacillus lacus]|uniref:Peptidase U32 n=1 Tax=Effusibacillus lacus TaxID=1348429 RepID=A0A292YJY3_9BACL|nr:peptidase U32 family protein [Effusibacillus lacus]TCS75110.1 putative protease [Effusibacillus lacus]GAX89063.1 peptidase U32 [Effusibacillus lacus]